MKSMKTGNFGDLTQERKWIPVSKELPPENVYILVSFMTLPVPAVAKCRGGKFYVKGCEDSAISHGIFADAWMPLPKSYEDCEEDE